MTIAAHTSVAIFMERWRNLWSLETHWLEFVMGLFMLRRALVWTFLPDAMADPVYAGLGGTWAQPYWSGACFATSVVMLVATFVNGDSGWTRPVRMWIMVAFFVLHFLLASAFFQPGSATAMMGFGGEMLWAALSAYVFLNIASKMPVARR